MDALYRGSLGLDETRGEKGKVLAEDALTNEDVGPGKLE
jgi:hypothetical protein